MDVAVTKEHVKIDGRIAEAVKDYIKCTEKIEEINNKLKDLKVARQEHEDMIKNFMEENRYYNFNVGDKVTFSLQTTKKNIKKINKKLIKDTLKSEQLSENLIDSIITNLYDVKPEDTEEVTKVKVSKRL
jgi:hypothetical protein